MASEAQAVKAIDLLRIAMGLETSAERKAAIDRQIAGVKMEANDYGVLVTLTNGRKILLSGHALEG